MMGARQVDQAALFYEFSLDRHVPADHLVRSIDRFVQLDALRRELAPFYSAIGRPSIDPELMIRMLLVGYCFGIRSERRLCDEVHLNLAYRWFCAREHAHRDPLASIPCSLLSSAEIHDYARFTGMLSPFDANALKSASYEAHIGGEATWWDENGDRHTRQIRRGDHFVLRANSITFVQVEPVFRLPDYIAIRFNLRITHVHRGLLLGTGPLVDPGFEGKLLIPLHNLTSSDYHLDTNEALIWIEFTKTTHGCVPSEPEASKARHFRGFPNDKKNLTPDRYLQKANRGSPIRSSIPAALEEGRRSAVEAARSATQLRNWLTGLGALGVTGLLIGLITLYLQMGAMVQSSNSLTASVDQSIAQIVSEIRSTSERSMALQGQFDNLTAQFDQELLASANRNTAAMDRAAALQNHLDELAERLEKLSLELTELSGATSPADGQQ